MNGPQQYLFGLLEKPRPWCGIHVDLVRGLLALKATMGSGVFVAQVG